MANEKYTHYIYDVPSGSTKEKHIYFLSYAEAWRYVMEHDATGAPGGMFHIYPVDNSGYTSRSEGRKSFGEGNKDWERKNK